jgi:phosphoribosylformylglycinamidine cyclo-ligase
MSCELRAGQPNPTTLVSNFHESESQKLTAQGSQLTAHSYSDAGVDLALAEQITYRITTRLGSGLFGGFFPASALKGYDRPVLVSSIDGIGTKVRLAARLGQVDGLGQDIVHHCVNDLAVHGAVPLFFMDYLAFSRLEPDLVERIVASIAQTCAALGITLAGGETAEMPLVYPEGHFDIAGAIVGAAEESEIVDGRTIVEGDVLLGLPAAGLHTNGFSLVQHVCRDEEYGLYQPDLGRTLGEALLEPHRCYLSDIRSLLARRGAVHGMAHITGGGIVGNLARVVPPGLQAVVELPPAPPLFAYLADRGLSAAEMRRVFNMGIGLIAVCDPGILDPQLANLVVGSVHTTVDSERRVIIRDDD